MDVGLEKKLALLVLGELRRPIAIRGGGSEYIQMYTKIANPLCTEVWATLEFYLLRHSEQIE